MEDGEACGRFEGRRLVLLRVAGLVLLRVPGLGFRRVYSTVLSGLGFSIPPRDTYMDRVALHTESKPIVTIGLRRICFL